MLTGNDGVSQRAFDQDVLHSAKELDTMLPGQMPHAPSFPWLSFIASHCIYQVSQKIV